MKCLMCGFENENGAICKKCGAPIRQKQQTVETVFVSVQKCPNCGRDYKTGDTECKGCGGVLKSDQPMEEYDPDVEIPSSFSIFMGKIKSFLAAQKPATYVLCAVGLIVIAAAIVVLSIALSKHSPYQSVSHSAVLLLGANENGDYVAVTSSGELIDIGADIGTQIIKHEYAADKSALACLTQNGELIYVTSKGAMAVANRVGEFAISANGKRIVYLTEVSDYAGTIHVFDGEVSKNIASRVYAERFAISPNGKTLLFGNNYDYDNDSYTTVYYANASIRDIGKDLVPIAVSNGARYIYYSKTEGTVNNTYLLKNKETEVLLGANVQHLVFNDDFSDVAFSDGIKTHLLDNGKNMSMISNSVIDYVLAPDYAASFEDAFGCYSQCFIPSFDNVTGMFSDAYGNSICCIQKKGKDYSLTVVASEAADYQLSLDGESMLYLKGDSLYKVASLSNPENALQLFEGVSSFCATRDLSGVYVITNTEQRKLCYVSDRDGMKEIGPDVADMAIAYDGRLYYSANGEINTVKDGKKQQTMFSLGQNAEMGGSCGRSVICQIENDGRTVYFFLDGKEHAEIGKVSSITQGS